jgi:hypothetical protein
MPAGYAAALLLFLQAELMSCRYHSLPPFKFSSRFDAAVLVMIEIDGETFSTGVYTRDESAKCGLVADELREAAGGVRINLPGELQHKVR